MRIWTAYIAFLSIFAKIFSTILVKMDINIKSKTQNEFTKPLLLLAKIRHF